MPFGFKDVLARVPRKRQAEAKHFLARYGQEFPTATEVLAKHPGECLAFYRFPEHHWKNI